jgi:hypothetical protein
MIHNFESWFKSKTGVNEQMVIKVGSAGGGSKKASGGSSSGGAAAAKTPKASIDIAKVAAFFEALPGRGDTKKDPWGPNSVSCIFPHLDKRYEIFVWTSGFAIRETAQFKFILGSDSAKLKLNLADYSNWTGSYMDASNVKIDFSNWDDFKNKAFGQQANAVASGFGADDPTRADQLVEEIVNDIDGLLKSEGFKGQFKPGGSDDVKGAVVYIQTDWWPNTEGKKVKALKAEIDKLPPQDKGGSGNRERLQKTYDLLNWELGNCAWKSTNGNEFSYFGECIRDRTDEFKFNYTGPNGPISRTWYTDF